MISKLKNILTMITPFPYDGLMNKTPSSKRGRPSTRPADPVTFSVTISRAYWTELDRRARDEKRPRTFIAARAIARYLDNYATERKRELEEQAGVQLAHLSQQVDQITQEAAYELPDVTEAEARAIRIQASLEVDRRGKP